MAGRGAPLRSLRSPASGETVGMRTCRPRPAPVPRSALAGFRFPPDVIILAVRWYLRFGLSYRDAEELLAERGVEVDHVTVYRSVQRFTPLLADAARPCRHAVGDCWWVDETVRHEVRCDRTGGRSPPLGCRSSLVKLGPPDLGGARAGGSSPDNDGTGRYCQTARVRQARWDGVRVQEPVVEPPQATPTGSNLVGGGRAATHADPQWWDGACDQPKFPALGGHGEGLRRTRGEAAGEKLGTTPPTGTQ
jgi:hypothetical protein